MNLQFEVEAQKSYNISPQLQLESHGMGDGYYFIKIAQIVFRCKILGLLDGYLDTNLKESIAISSVDYESQMNLRDEFEVQKKFVIARNFIEKIGFYENNTQTFYRPDQLEFDLGSRSIFFIHTGVELDISNLNLDKQKELVYESELESLSFRMNEFLDDSMEFFGLIYEYKNYLTIKSKLADLFVSVVELSNFYPLDETLQCIKDYLTQFLILFKFPKPNVRSFIDLLIKLKDDLKLLRDLRLEFCNDIIDKIRQIRSLSSYLFVVSRFSNFGDRYNFHALLEFFNFLIYYSSLAELNPRIFQKLTDFKFQNKFENYLSFYLDSKRVMKMLSDGQRINVTNEINLIEKILNHSDLMDFDYVSDLQEKIIGLKMAFHLHN